MKKKFKLITSVASLCLALTLMVFGVHAATAPQITVSGSVSFTATNVLATITGVKGTGESSTWATTLTEIEYGLNTEDAQTMAVGEIALTDLIATGGYKITITSDFDPSSATKVLITSTLPATITGTGYTITFEGDSNWTTATTTGLTGGQSATVTVTATVNPALANATFTQDIGMTITLDRG